MNKYYLNKSYVLVNDIKTYIVFVFFMMELFIISLLICSYIDINFWFALIGLLLAVLLLYSKYYKNIIIQYMINFLCDKRIINENILNHLEKISFNIGIKTPKIVIAKSNQFFVYNFGFDKNNSYIIISSEIISNLEDDGIRYILAQQIHLISNNDTKISSYLSLYFAVPVLIFEIFINYLERQKYLLIANILNIFRYIILSFYVLPVYVLILSKRRIYNSDLGASKILRTTIGFDITLEMFSKSPNIYGHPKIILINKFTKNSKSILDNILSIQPNIKDRITHIHSLIG